MASHLRLHLAAPPPLLLHHRRRLHLPRLTRPPAGCPSLNPARAPLLPLPRRRLLSRARAVGGGAEEGAGAGLAEGEGEEAGGGGLVGEDSAAFRLGDQSVASWAYFAVILAAVLWALNVLWIDPGTGVGTKFLDAVASVSDRHEIPNMAVQLKNSNCIGGVTWYRGKYHCNLDQLANTVAKTEVEAW